MSASSQGMVTAVTEAVKSAMASQGTRSRSILGRKLTDAEKQVRVLTLEGRLIGKDTTMHGPTGEAGDKPQGQGIGKGVRDKGPRSDKTGNSESDATEKSRQMWCRAGRMATVRAAAAAMHRLKQNANQCRIGAEACTKARREQQRKESCSVEEAMRQLVESMRRSRIEEEKRM